MHHTLQHRSANELVEGLADVESSPADDGQLVAIFVRPATNERQSLRTATLTSERGIDGDRWMTDSFYRLESGQPDPRCQVSLMNGRFLRQIAGREDNMCLAGDNLIVDLDLSETNLPVGSQLAIGPEVVIEISDLSHTGCSKFASRYGQDAREFANNARGKSLRLRGRYGQIVRGGTIRIGESVRKRAPM
jgi:MOSC domain